MNYTNFLYWEGCVDNADDAYNKVENHNEVTMRLIQNILKNYDGYSNDATNDDINDNNCKQSKRMMMFLL